MGSEHYDYIIADKIVIPEENKKYFSEMLLVGKNPGATIFLMHKTLLALVRNNHNLVQLFLPINNNSVASWPLL